MQTSTKILWFNTSIIMMLIFGFVFPSFTVRAATDPGKYPKIGNYFLRGGTDLTPNMIPPLARYDLLVLPAEVQITNPTLFHELRKQNPDIILLAYMASTSYAAVWHDTLHTQLLAGIRNEWWLRDHTGKQLSIWPETRALNLASGWSSYLADFTIRNVWNTGLWDGIFFDEVGQCIVCSGLRTTPFNVDLNLDGLQDDGVLADRAWHDGTLNLLRTFQERTGGNAIAITNGSSAAAYQPFVNGRMYESFPTPWEADGSWEKIMQDYDQLTRLAGGKPPVFFLDGDTENTGAHTNFRDVRFGLTSALLKGGYFGYSWGSMSRGQLWWYDEYDVALGNPRGEPMIVGAPRPTTFVPEVWRRDFENGIVLVNATRQTKTIALDHDFEKIHGLQDPATNDGSIVQEVELSSQDGVILLRLVDQVENLTFTNGSFARILKATGEVARTGFFLSDEHSSGGSEIQRTDLDQDGDVEIVVASGGKISVWDESSATSIATWAPYGPDWRGEIHIAIGDTNGDGSKEIITTPGKGGGPHVRIFASNGRLLSPGFFAFEPSFRSGVNVATGDIDPSKPGDEIVVGRGMGGRPEVRIFRANGSIIQQGFDAYAPSFRGGVYVAAGDVDGDGTMEIVTGAGRGGGPHVRIFAPNGAPEGRGFFPYQKNWRTGVRVGTVDLDGNGTTEIFAMTPERD